MLVVLKIPTRMTIISSIEAR